MKTEIIERLLNAGGDPNDPDENGWTARCTTQATRETIPRESR